MKIDKYALARILQEEFDADGWGDIDPNLFEIVANRDPAEAEEPSLDPDDIDEDDEDEMDEDLLRDADGMEEVLDRVAKRLAAQD